MDFIAGLSIGVMAGVIGMIVVAIKGNQNKSSGESKRVTYHLISGDYWLLEDDTLIYLSEVLPGDYTWTSPAHKTGSQVSYMMNGCVYHSKKKELIAFLKNRNAKPISKSEVDLRKKVEEEIAKPPKKQEVNA